MVVVLACTLPFGKVAMAVWLLGFWHYGLYWLAYRYGRIALEVFKRDALFAKTIALGAFLAVYLDAPLDVASLVLAVCGFGLNAIAAARLGADRTYYGREIAGLVPLRVRGFPYSVMSHPMLVGNMIGFGATLLNDAFRRDWWPLALAHVAMNVGLLVMETRVVPGRFRLGARSIEHAYRSGNPWPVLGFVVAATAAAVAAALLDERGPETVAAICVTAAVIAHGCILHYRYTAPDDRPRQGDRHE